MVCIFVYNVDTLHICGVFQLSYLGTTTFFVENVSELQLNALRLITNVSIKKSSCIYRNWMKKTTTTIPSIKIDLTQKTIFYLMSHYSKFLLDDNLKITCRVCL